MHTTTPHSSITSHWYHTAAPHHTGTTQHNTTPTQHQHNPQKRSVVNGSTSTLVRFHLSSSIPAAICQHTAKSSILHTNNNTHSTMLFHGIFSGVNRTVAAVVIQRAWRTCRYDPGYAVCERVVLGASGLSFAETPLDIIEGAQRRARYRACAHQAEVDRTRARLARCADARARHMAVRGGKGRNLFTFRAPVGPADPVTDDPVTTVLAVAARIDSDRLHKLPPLPKEMFMQILGLDQAMKEEELMSKVQTQAPVPRRDTCTHAKGGMNMNCQQRCNHSIGQPQRRGQSH